MPLHSILRAMGTARRARARTSPAGAPPAPASRRHPAMSGLNVSPVHGRHCICSRCVPDERDRLPLAG